MAITTDYQGELGGVTFGAGTDYRITGPIGGLGVPSVRATDTPRGTDHGSASGLNRFDVRVLTIPLAIRNQTSAAAANQAFTTLRAAWVPADSDVELTLRMPGSPETVMSYFGRPRGIQAIYETGTFPNGTIRSLIATFQANDPLQYGASTDDNNNTGTFTVANSGNMASRRATFTITADGGGAPSLTNDTDSDDGAVTWTSVLSNGTVRVINLRDRTVTDGSGVNKLSEIDPSSLWFALEPGNNSIIEANCSDVDLTYRSAWA